MALSIGTKTGWGKLKLGFVAAATCLVSGEASAAVVFQEDFDLEAAYAPAAVKHSFGQFLLSGGLGIQVHQRGGIAGNPFNGRQFIGLDVREEGGVRHPPNSRMAALCDLVPNRVYQVRFAYRPLGFIEGDSQIDLSIGLMDESGFTATALLGSVSKAVQSSPGWEVVRFVFTAPEGVNALEFAANGPGNGFGGLVDAIRVTDLAASEVPLPAGWLLFAGGAFALRLTRRRG